MESAASKTVFGLDADKQKQEAADAHGSAPPSRADQEPAATFRWEKTHHPLFSSKHQRSLSYLLQGHRAGPQESLALGVRGVCLPVLWCKYRCILW